MTPLPPLRRGNSGLVVAHGIESDESLTEAIIEAFLLAGLDVYSEPTQVADWVEPDVLEGLDFDAPQTYLGTRIWDHHILITGEEVRIYERFPPN